MENKNERDLIQEPIDVEEPTVFEDPSDVMEPAPIEAPAEAAEPAEPEKTPETAETADIAESEPTVDEEVAEAGEPAGEATAAQPAKADTLLSKAGRAVNTVRQQIEASHSRRAKASKATAKDEKSGSGEKPTRHAKRAEQKSHRKTKEERQQELERRKEALQHTTAELSEKLKHMLSDDIKAMNKREKTRAAEILGVFTAHNFYANGFTPVEMRTTLEDLGPTYVKIGQIMSSRVDMLPESYCKELEKLRQNVKMLDPEIARAVIEQETGKKIDEIYSEFRDKPLGSASIGQAHYGVLLDGTRVVTKVQRPLIADMMRKDFVLLKKLASLINIVNEANEDEDQMIDLMSVIEELEKVTEEELDFRVEAENTRFFKENCITDEAKCTCPTVIDELTTERIFTMTFVDGYSVSKRDRLIEEGYDPSEIGTAILDNYFHQVLDVGTFHGDPHQGNIMVAHGVPTWIDFGMIGRITDADVNIMQNLILSLVERDMDALVNAIMSMGAASSKTDRNKLLEDADAMFEKYMNVTNLDELDLSALLGEITDLASKHHISLPGKYTMLVRSIATIEGVMEQLCPELNLFQIISDKMIERMKKSFNVEQELLGVGKDALELGKKATRMPGMLYDLLNNTVKGRLKLNMELTGYEEIVDSLSKTVKDIVLALFASVIFFGSCILSVADIQPKTPGGQPLVSAVGIVFSIALGVHTVKRMSHKK